ncbi:MAG: hemerythrin domain-containing protein [Enhygromyxa sp.]
MTARSDLRDWLSGDHEEIDGLLRSALGSEPFDLAVFAQFRERLLRHIGIEERLLFPAVKRAHEGQLPVSAGPLRVDHAALTSLLVPTPDHALAREIAGLLEGHNLLEERAGGVYDECIALLDDASAEAVLRDARQRRPVPTTKYFDGPGTVRTAAEALAKARRAHAKSRS